MKVRKKAVTNSLVAAFLCYKNLERKEGSDTCNKNLKIEPKYMVQKEGNMNNFEKMVMQSALQNELNVLSKQLKNLTVGTIEREMIEKKICTCVELLEKI